MAAPSARLGRSQELRNLFKPAQLAALYGEQRELVWLSGDITMDRTPALRRYLIQELDIPELTPEAVIQELDQGFLKAQSDSWVERLYEFLGGQPALWRRFEVLPLVRLEDGSHVSAQSDGQPQAFLPGSFKTGFPLVRAAVCASEASLDFLRSLGLTQPDPVDDVIRSVLPKYQRDEVDVGDADYESDIARMLNAFGTDSQRQREKLLSALRASAFVRVVDAGNGSKWFSNPGKVYLATERLKELFADVEDVLLVDDTYTCLHGEGIRDLLEACGATRYLQPVPVECHLSEEQLAAIRRNAGVERSTKDYPVADKTLRGLDALLSLMQRLGSTDQRQRAALLWEALADVESRRGPRTFVVDYKWRYGHQTKTAAFDAAFVKQLRETEWVPDVEGNRAAPALVIFDTLGWKSSPFLLSKIHFKPPIVDQLAKEAGIEPGALDLLKKLGVTSEADLRERLGVKDETSPPDGAHPDNVDDALQSLLGETPPPTPPVPDPAGAGPTSTGGRKRPGSGGGTSAIATGRQTKDAGQTSAGRASGNTAGRQFISYVRTHPDDESVDPDGLDQAARMALEATAIDFILSRETRWQRTPTHNPGFDLYQPGPDDLPVQWCEVKAMTGSLTDRPVGLSRTQFECASLHGDAYWLYVVERAGTDHVRIVRIQNPAGNARTFTFDHGWLKIAEMDSNQDHPKD